MLSELKQSIKDIEARYTIIRSEYHATKDMANHDLLLDFRDRFAKLFGDLIPIITDISYWKVSRDDKACTGIKSRIAASLEGTKDENNKAVSWNKAIVLAAGTENYKKFLEERTVVYSLYTNAYELKESIGQYIGAVASRLKMPIRNE